MDKLSILILEDDPAARKALEKYASKFDDITIVSITDSADKAIEDILMLAPNVLILDLELHNGQGSGLDVLMKLNRSDLPFHPYIIIATNNTSLTTYEFARQEGADYIISKHQKDYSEKMIIDILREMKKSILSGINSGEISSTFDLTVRIKRAKRRIIVELNRIGINPKSLGYQYLFDAIALTIENPTKNAIAALSQKYNVSEKNITRTMQNAIKQAWKSSSIDELYRNYTAKTNAPDGIPTISEFIYYYANKVGQESMSLNI